MLQMAFPLDPVLYKHTVIFENINQKKISTSNYCLPAFLDICGENKLKLKFSNLGVAI